MAGMIKSSVHHFEGCGGVGLAGNGSGKDGRRAAICGASLVSAGLDTVEATFGVVSTISVRCCGGIHCPLRPQSVACASADAVSELIQHPAEGGMLPILDLDPAIVAAAAINALAML